MKKARLFTTLLLSALMVFGVFGLTSFAAEGDDATGDVHKWNVWTSTKYAGAVAFNCNADHDCAYKSNTVFGIVVSDDVYNGQPFDFYGNTELEFHENEEAGLPDDFDLSYPQYRKSGDTNWSDAAPTDVGTYDVREEIIVNNEKKSIFVTSSFRIVNPVVSVDEKIVYGTDIDKKVKVSTDPETNQEFHYVVEYKSTDVPGAKYTKITPFVVGNYRVRATFDNGAYAEDDFSLLKNTADTITPLGISVDPSTLISGIKNYTFENKTIGDVRSELRSLGFSAVTFVYKSGDTDIYEAAYGKPLFFLMALSDADDENSDSYILRSKYFGLPDITFKNLDTKKTKKFAQGSVLPAGNYELTFSTKATINHVAATGKITLSVTKGTARVTKSPKAKEGLIASDYYQKLIIPGTAVGGHFEYALKEGETDPADKDYSRDIPTAMKAGSYTVCYKLVGDDNHSVQGVTGATGQVTVTIADAEKEDDPETVIVPGVKNVKLNAGKRYFKVSWSKFSEENLDKIDKIEIQYSRTADFSKGVKTKLVSKNKTSYKVKSLRKGTYYVRVRAVKYGAENADGEVIPKAVSKEYSAIKSVKVK